MKKVLLAFESMESDPFEIPDQELYVEYPHHLSDPVQQEDKEERYETYAKCILEKLLS